MKYTYLLTINPQQIYSPDELKAKLDIAVDWVKLMPNVFLVFSTSDLDKWYSRLKPVLGDNQFFMADTNIEYKKCTGWLYESTWDSVKKIRKRFIVLAPRL